MSRVTPGPILRYRLSDFTDGWVIGDFLPSVYRTSQFEVALKHHRAGEDYPAHYQKLAWEINILVQGRLCLGAECYDDGDVFVLPPRVAAKPIFVTDCTVVCVKIPSLTTDKVVVE